MTKPKEKLFLRIRNFTCLNDVELELKPITLLFGNNGSGKSSLLKAIRFLSHNLFNIYVVFRKYGPDENNYFVLDKDTDLVSYNDLVTNNDSHNRIQFDIRIESTDVDYSELKKFFTKPKEGSQSSNEYVYINPNNVNRLETIIDEKILNNLNGFDWDEDVNIKSKKDDKIDFADDSITTQISIIFIPFKGGQLSLKITINDLNSGISYSFDPNSAYEENDYTYDKKITATNEILTQLLTETLAFERHIPFVDLLDNYHSSSERDITNAIQSFNNRLLKWIHKNKDKDFWQNFSDSETWNFYTNALKYYYRTFYSIPSKINDYFREVVDLPAVREIPKSSYLMREGRFLNKDYYGLLKEFDPKDNLKGIPHKIIHDEKSYRRTRNHLSGFSLPKLINFFIKDMKLARYIKIKADKERLAGDLYYKSFDGNSISNLAKCQ